MAASRPHWLDWKQITADLRQRASFRLIDVIEFPHLSLGTAGCGGNGATLLVEAWRIR